HLGEGHDAGIGKAVARGSEPVAAPIHDVETDFARQDGRDHVLDPGDHQELPGFKFLSEQRIGHGLLLIPAGVDRGGGQSSLMFAVRTMSAMRSSSRATSSWKLSGEPGVATTPSPARRSLTSSCLSTFCNASFSLVMTDLGVPAGVIRPTQELKTKSSTPSSIRVGTSGSEGAR